MKKILAGNWKLHKTQSEVEAFFKDWTALCGDSRNKFVSSLQSTLLIAPSPSLLIPASNWSRESNLSVYSQNVAWKAEGAFTGATSAKQIVDSGATGTLVGHSELRQYCKDTPERCALRAQEAWRENLEVIFCIGESLEERKRGQTEEVLFSQLEPLLALENLNSQKLVVAYEPVWAIGTGQVATVEQIAHAHESLAQWLSENKLAATPILYGGSVKPENFKEISTIPNVSGALVGGASLKAQDFFQLLEILEA